MVRGISGTGVGSDAAGKAPWRWASIPRGWACAGAVSSRPKSATKISLCTNSSSGLRVGLKVILQVGTQRYVMRPFQCNRYRPFPPILKRMLKVFFEAGYTHADCCGSTLQGDIAMLLPWVRHDFILEHPKAAANPHPGFIRRNHVVDVSALCGDVRIGEFPPVLIGEALFGL